MNQNLGKLTYSQSVGKEIDTLESIVNLNSQLKFCYGKFGELMLALDSRSNPQRPAESTVIQLNKRAYYQHAEAIHSCLVTIRSSKLFF